VHLAVIGADPWFTEALRSLLADTGAFRLALLEPDVDSFTARPEARGIDIAIVACAAASAETARLVAWARKVHPHLRVIAKFDSLRPEFVRNAMQAGARGAFSAEDPPETLLTVLNSVATGHVSFPFVDFSTMRDDPFEQLTRREREVLGALSKGWTNQQISARLGISENTVKYHLRLIYDKLGVANRSSAVSRYLARMQG
jgi:two-component system nitrate/nitrite response regulator NarP